MMTTIGHAAEWFAYGIIPWWLYVIASFAAAVALIVWIPGRLGLVLGLIAALILGDLGFTAKGYQMGTAAEAARTEAKIQAERQRLQAGFAADLLAEQARTAAATTLAITITKERDDAIQAATPQVDASGNPTASPVALPPGISGCLYTGRCGEPGAPRRAKSPATLRRLFRKAVPSAEAQ